MLIRQVAYSVIFCILFTGVANAESSLFSAFGMNNISCGKYIQDVTTTPSAAAVYSWWIAGFVTGTNLEKRRAVSTDSPAHEAWLKKYCQDNPLNTFMKAAMELNEVLDKL